MGYDDEEQFDDPPHDGDDYGVDDDGAQSMTSTKEERTWAMACHLSTFSGSFVPFGNVIAPLIIWMLKKDEMPLVDDQGKEAINFQISIMIYLLVSVILVFVVIGIPMLIALGIFDLVVTIIAAIKAYEGEYYRYPMCIRFI